MQYRVPRVQIDVWNKTLDRIWIEKEKKGKLIGE